MIFYHAHSWILYPSMISKNVVKYSLIFSLNYALLIGCISIIYRFGHIRYSIPTSITKDLLNIFSFFFFMGLSFRLNTAYTNWSNGVDMVIKIMHHSIDSINILYTQLYTNTKKYNENNMMLNQFKHHILEYISTLFNIPKNQIHRRRSTLDMFKIDNRHYLPKVNASLYDAISSTTIEHQLPYQRSFLRMEFDIRKTLYQNKLDHYFSDTQYNYIQNKIDTLFAYRVQLYKIQNIPPVCIYIQLFDFYMYTYLLLYGITIIPQSNLYSCTWTFIWGFIVSLALNVAREIDTPFGDDKNDIQMDSILERIKKEIELITFVLK